MLVIICANYENNPSRIVHAVERTQEDVSYSNSFTAKSWLNDLKYIGQGQSSLSATHSFTLVIICAQYGKNASKNVGVTEQTRNAGRMVRRTDRQTVMGSNISPNNFNSKQDPIVKGVRLDMLASDTQSSCVDPLINPTIDVPHIIRTFHTHWLNVDTVLSVAQMCYTSHEKSNEISHSVTHYHLIYGHWFK